MASPRTPKRRRGGSGSAAAVSWATLLRPIPQEEQSELNLEPLLADLGPAETFLGLSVRGQRSLLVGTLGDGSPLVERILACAGPRSSATATEHTVAKVTSFVWAPSTALDDEALRAVINELFPKRLALAELLSSFVFSDPYTSTDAPTGTPAPSRSASFLKQVQEGQEAFMPGLHSKEACGYPLLGVFLTQLAQELTLAFQNTLVSADMQFVLVTHKLEPGTKPACDGAVSAIVVHEGNPKKPLILYEYKPVVDPRTQFVHRNDLLEVLLQGYYCLFQHNRPTVLHCLTDLSQWFYFKLEKVKPGKMQIAWYKAFSEQQLSFDAQLTFLKPVLCDLLQQPDVSTVGQALRNTA